MTRFCFNAVTDAIEIVALGMLLAAIALVVPARAAEAATLVDHLPDLTILAIFVTFILGFILGNSRRSRVHVVDREEALGDLTGYGRDGKWRQ